MDGRNDNRLRRVGDMDSHELLIRIDERVGDMGKEIAVIKTFMSNAPCKITAEKVRTLERIVWGCVSIAGIQVVGLVFFIIQIVIKGKT